MVGGVAARAVSLGELPTALELAEASGSELKWRQLGELALSTGKLQARPGLSFPRERMPMPSLHLTYRSACMLPALWKIRAPEQEVSGSRGSRRVPGHCSVSKVLAEW